MYTTNMEALRVPIQHKYQLLLELEAEVPPEKVKTLMNIEALEKQALETIISSEITISKEKAKYRERIVENANSLIKDAKSLRDGIDEAFFKSTAFSKDSDVMTNTDIENAQRQIK